jgi:protein-tyrosine-phosphatase
MISVLWQKLARRLARVHERWRASRAARARTGLTTRVAHARTILFVCFGNIIRSAFAAELLRARCGEPGDLSIRSAGTNATTDDPAHPTAQRCAQRFGIDLSHHRTHRLGESDLEEADIVLAMELDHIVDIRRRFPEHGDKVYLFTCLTDVNPRDVSDPVFSPEAAFEACFERIHRGIRQIVAMRSSRRRSVQSGGADIRK